MAPLLLSTLTSSSRGQQPLLLVQSSTAQSCLPVVQYVVRQADSNPIAGSILLFCLLYAPSAFVKDTPENVRVFDWTHNVPGYAEDALDVKEEMLRTVRDAPPGPLTAVIDSVDTLLSDLGSLARTERFLSELLSAIRARPSPSRLVLHVVAPSRIIPALMHTRLSPILLHIIAHPTALILHLATAYLTMPPPLSPPEKFWSVFLPIAERHYESEKLVFGPGGEGSGGREFVVEVLVRGADGPGRRRGVERVLEGWSGIPACGSPCELSQLESLKGLWTRKVVEESGPDPTKNLSFNLNLTIEQQQSRAQVPLPYAHEGKQARTSAAPAAILYDPDSADDIDDDDPDEDLDI
ncbi:uncharacterized protein LAESUDRAFT_759086 [Laetiporus sulphureus 93-53]|uniref:Elongator complex protein 5 n=1 Tax=Laetiporus sulphureus 93-53 TaxID=1314785 RepID=A0A165EF62_9APHY|nr:uncharacterized protein LAESUDRAFT_759086 [Laetiporus sulphureus 93-53]KZT06922.1 hypothetical protein LAESUDRAFT_759086 [Laetiporus sulphureus 93-53]